MNSNKNITFLISTLSGGGAEGVCVGIANSFANNGWKVDLVVLNLNNAAYLDRLSDKVNLVVLNTNHARFSSIPILKYIYKNKVKTILVFNYELSVVLVILRIILKLKIKIVSRSISTFSAKMMQFYKMDYQVLPVLIPQTHYKELKNKEFLILWRMNIYPVIHFEKIPKLVYVPCMFFQMNLGLHMACPIILLDELLQHL